MSPPDIIAPRQYLGQASKNRTISDAGTLRRWRYDSAQLLDWQILRVVRPLLTPTRRLSPTPRGSWIPAKWSSSAATDT
ncbi:hypothetical protein SAMN05216525_105126 [Bradyrhizobium sp. Gha]|nr:hypothetical protein SAMN05216525_105126 [Bradyrhizobium sp. Gha]